nr:pyrroline-5-carboxylate reductase [Raoultella sp. NCTC 9187]
MPDKWRRPLFEPRWRRGPLRAEEISLEDIDPGRIAALAERYGLARKPPREDALREAELVVLGIRPQDNCRAWPNVFGLIFLPATTTISLIAGVTLHKLESVLGAENPIARVIPNTLTDTGFGYSGVVLNAQGNSRTGGAFLSGFGRCFTCRNGLLISLPASASPGRTTFITLSSRLPMRACWPACRARRQLRWFWKICRGR